MTYRTHAEAVKAVGSGEGRANRDQSTSTSRLNDEPPSLDQATVATLDQAIADRLDSIHVARF
jgi:hypothetical protein